jgi:hypothetical protein
METTLKEPENPAISLEAVVDANGALSSPRIHDEDQVSLRFVFCHVEDSIFIVYVHKNMYNFFGDNDAQESRFANVVFFIDTRLFYLLLTHSG